MKRIFIFIIASIMSAKSDKFPAVNLTRSRYSIPIINIIGNNIALVYFKENNTDETLINSLLQDLYAEQCAVITSGGEYSQVVKRLHRHEIVRIILTETLNVEDLKSEQFNAMFKSSWSPIYIILTTNNGHETCEDGILSEDFFNNALNYLNIIWHRHQVITLVVSFPYTCPQHYIIYDGKKPSDKMLYNRTIKMVLAKNKYELKVAILANTKVQQLTEDYPLRANIFYRFPTSITDCDNIGNYVKWNVSYSNWYCGLDGLVMHDFLQHYKYKLVLPNDKRCDEYGYLEPKSQNATGSLGCVIREELDISFNSRFEVQYKSAHYFYLHYVTVDSLCVVIKRPGTIALWHYAYNMYNGTTGFILLVLIFALGAFTWASAWISKETTRQKPEKLYIYIINSLTSTLFGSPVNKKSEMFRILKGTSLFCSIILLALYQGNVNYKFTTRTRYKTIRTLQHLYHSSITLYTSPSLRDLILSSGNPNHKSQWKYLQRIHLKNETLGIGFVLDDPDSATLTRGNDVQIQVLLNFTDEHGSPVLHIVDECFEVYYLAYIARVGFLFTDESRSFMMRILEAGLPDKYYVWTRHSLKLGSIYPKSSTEPRPFEKKKLKNLRVAFGILAFGYFVSSCAFIVEIYRGKNRKPM